MLSFVFVLVIFNKSFQTSKIQKILKSINGKILERNNNIIVMSAFGPSSDIELALKSIGKNNLLEVVRSGSLGLHEGESTLKI